MTEPASDKRPLIPVICLGGKGKKDSKFLKRELPAEFVLLLSNSIETISYPKSVATLLRHLDAEQTYPIEVGELDVILPELLEGIDTLFIVLGLGGDTGTKRCLKLAEAAHGRDIQTFCFASKPFDFEIAPRFVSKNALNRLMPHITALITFDNNLLIKKLGGDALLDDAFQTQSRWLLQAMLDVRDWLNVPSEARRQWPSALKSIELGAGESLAEILQMDKSLSHQNEQQPALTQDPPITTGSAQAVSPELEQRRKGKPRSGGSMTYKEFAEHKAKKHIQLVNMLEITQGKRCLNFCLPLPSSFDVCFYSFVSRYKKFFANISWLNPRMRMARRVSHTSTSLMNRIMNRIFNRRRVIVGIGERGRNIVEQMRALLFAHYEIYSFDHQHKECGQYSDDDWKCFQHIHELMEPKLVGSKVAAYTVILNKHTPIFIVSGLGDTVSANEAIALSEIAKQKGIYVNCFVNMPLEAENERNSLAKKAIGELEKLQVSCLEFKNDSLYGETRKIMTLEETYKYQAKFIADKIIPCSHRMIRKRAIKIALIILIPLILYYFSTALIDNSVLPKMDYT
jgi:hypothetical protein